MRATIGFITLLFLLPGCTHIALRDNTADTGSTLTDLQYQIVLDNIAMFKCNSDSLPWGIKITQGSMQLTDAVTPSFSYAWPAVTRTGTLGGSRTWQDSWTVVPVTSKGELEELKAIYKVEVAKKWFHLGTLVPRGCPSGHYGTLWVWVDKDHVSDLTAVVLQVLDKTPIKAEERSIILPGPPR
jgi:hypothetical protein